MKYQKLLYYQSLMQLIMVNDIYLIAMTWKQFKSIRKRIDKRRGCKMPEKYC